MFNYESIPKEEAEKLIKLCFDSSWNFYKVSKENSLSGIVLIKDNEIHCWRSPTFKGRWITRQDIENTLGTLIKKYSFVKTSVLKENSVGHKFVQRLGFKPVKEDEKVIYYETEYLNHARL